MEALSSSESGKHLLDPRVKPGDDGGGLNQNPSNHSVPSPGSLAVVWR